MQEVERVDWPPDARTLWRRIEAHPFEREDHALDFTGRLARDRGWSLDFARGAVAEYRRFCFLATVFDTPVTPSEEVDEVWHQHLTYSRDYWERWCGRVLGMPLHHDPTAGGPAEQGRYRAQYAETLARYEAYFGPPPAAFWPGTANRFRGRPRYRTVDENRVWLVPRPRLLARVGGWFGRIAGALAVLPAAPRPAQALPSDAAPFNALPFNALPLDPLDWTAAPFLTLYVGLGLATCLVALLRRGLRMANLSGPPTRDLGLLDLALLAGGRERAADTVVVGWLRAGAARIDRSAPGLLGIGRDRIAVDDSAARLPAEWEPLRGALRGSFTRDALVSDLKTRFVGVEAALERRGLVPSPLALHRLKVEMAVLFAPVLLFGLVKVLVGMARGKPVGILIYLMFALALIGLILMVKPPLRTGSGKAALAAHRTRYRRAASAPRPHELLFAFALGGAAVLAGSELDAYGRLIRASERGGGDGGSESGDGGGGCGGCGGGGD